MIRSGHLKIQATCDIPFQTEVLLDYNLIRYCFHPSGSCSSSKPPLLVLTKNSIPICFLVLSELPYDISNLVKCNSCCRGIHNQCLTAEDLAVIESSGITCSNCLSLRKKRALKFGSQPEE